MISFSAHSWKTCNNWDTCLAYRYCCLTFLSIVARVGVSYGMPCWIAISHSWEDSYLTGMALMDHTTMSRAVSQETRLFERQVSAWKVRRRFQQYGPASSSTLAFDYLWRYIKDRKALSGVFRDVPGMQELCDLFSDEFRFCLQHDDCRIRVWRHRGQRTLPVHNWHRHIGLSPGKMLWVVIE